MSTYNKTRLTHEPALFVPCRLGLRLFVMTCVGCEKKPQNQAAAEDGVVTMRADLTEDDSTTVDCTIFNKTDKDIAIGE